MNGVKENQFQKRKAKQIEAPLGWAQILLSCESNNQTIRERNVKWADLTLVVFIVKKKVLLSTLLYWCDFRQTLTDSIDN